MKPRMNVYLTTAKRVLGYAYPMVYSLFEQNQDSEVYLYLASEDLAETDILEEKKLADEAYQSKIAESIKAGIDNYFTVIEPKSE